MARQEGITSISGKLDGKVYVRTRKGDIVRSAPLRKIRKDETSFNRQKERTAFLNSIARGLNTLVKENYAGQLSGDFYQRMQQRFRKEPLDERCLLLMSLTGINLHPAYPLDRMGNVTLKISHDKKTMDIVLATSSHPQAVQGADCYFDELALFTWNNKSQNPALQQLFSDWVNIEGDKYLFDFSFPVAGASHWLLCRRRSLGKNNKEKRLLSTTGMQVVCAGSFDKEEQQRMEHELSERMEKESALAPLERPEVKRVKGRRIE